MKRNFFIIGGGVAGLSVAYALLRQGQAVTVADHRQPGQSSWAGAGILCPLLPWDYEEAVNRLAFEGMRAWPDWAAALAREGIDAEYWACGMEVVAEGTRGSEAFPLPASPAERGRGHSPSPLAKADRSGRSVGSDTTFTPSQPPPASGGGANEFSPNPQSPSQPPPASGGGANGSLPTAGGRVPPPLAGEGRGGLKATQQKTPSPLAGEGRGGLRATQQKTPSPLAGEGRGGLRATQQKTPSPLAGEGWGGVNPTDAALAWCRQHDFPAERLSENRLWLPDVAQMRTPRLVAALGVAVGGLGGRILPERKITDLHVEDGRAVAALAGQSEYVADVFVWAGGAWAGQVLGGMAAVPNTRPVRGQMLLYAPGSHALKHILYRPDGLYLVPRRDGHLLVGSTVEDVGFDASTTPEILHRLHEAACELLPELRGHRPLRSWAGLRPGSPNNIPVIDRHPAYDNVWVNTGHFRYGVTMAPAGSRLLVELMLGLSPHIDPAPYDWQAALGRSWQ